MASGRTVDNDAHRLCALVDGNRHQRHPKNSPFVLEIGVKFSIDIFSRGNYNHQI